jgi:DNA topoisomerase-1
VTPVGRANGNSYTRRYVFHPAESAKAAGLRYVSDIDAAGIRRIARDGGFRYVDADGRTVRAAATLARIKSLAIPPAWTDVWICPRDDGHLQATGRDARGRKQYRYHARWRDVRDETKFGRMLQFAKVLPRIHRRVARDLRLPGLPRPKALATVVRLLETTCIRVGNEEYARQNDSFGLTTLRGRQVRVRGSTLRFRFRGKSGVRHDVELSDRQIAGIVKRMQDLPGEELLGYVDETGRVHSIESADVNAYLKDIAGEEFTSKDFRTWAGTVHAVQALSQLAPAGSQAEAKRNVVQVIEAVAAQLGNTKAVCRKCYIHPAVLETYLEDGLSAPLKGSAAVAGVVALLQARLKREARDARHSGAGGRSLEPVLTRSLNKLRRAANGRGAAASPQTV